MNLLQFKNTNLVCIYLFLLVVIQFMAIFGGQPNVSDSFHTGEFFSSTAHLTFRGESLLRTIQIHGLNDVLPSLLAQEIWGMNNHFIPTLALYRVLNFMAFLFLAMAAIQIGWNNKEQTLILIAIFVIGPALVSYRDVMLLFCVNIFLALQRKNLSMSLVIAMQILFGIATAFALFWSFDRGLAGAAALGIASIFSLRYDKRFAVALAFFVIAIIVLPNTYYLFSLAHYYDNLLVLISTSSQWSYGLRLLPIVLAIFAFYINVSVVAVFLTLMWSKLKDHQIFATSILLLVLVFFMIKIGTGRADLEHIQMAYWAPLLLIMNVTILNHRLFSSNFFPPVALSVATVAFSFSLLIPQFGVFPSVSAIVSGALLLIFFKITRSKYTQYASLIFSLILLLSVAYLVGSIGKKSMRGEFAWLHTLQSPMKNLHLADDSLNWISNALIESKTACIFDLSNNGIINALAQLPSCTRFTYPVYAGSHHEQPMIEELKQSDPSAIVYSSTNWSYSIDGKSMALRFPKLDSYVLQRFSKEECKFGYCIRYRSN